MLQWPQHFRRVASRYEQRSLCFTGFIVSGVPLAPDRIGYSKATVASMMDAATTGQLRSFSYHEIGAPSRRTNEKAERFPDWSAKAAELCRKTSADYVGKLPQPPLTLRKMIAWHFRLAVFKPPTL
ncbi:hypothetical protein Kim5_PD00085 (plasmid) [Rhizobium sp. Kim5]|nr:hypothetical protein Kim5_PD00085 [Rhizobium sp. Kim5]